MRRWLLRTLLFLLLLVVLVHCSSRTEAPPLPPGVKKEHIRLDLAGRSVSLTLYRPAKDENAPLVVVAHGFLRSKRYMAGWGGHLAGQGFFVVVPTQPAFADHELNGRVLAALVEKYREKRYVALMGFSMGGLTTLLATTHTPVDAWVGLDPVDMNGQGKVAAAKLKAPSLLLLAEPEAWNMHGNANALVEAIQGEKQLTRIPGATHLDAEWPTDLLGQLACGFVDEKRQQQFREKATAFLKATLLK
ncbi:MAG: alpha/beta fold hydrolase [Verrucomicrobiaceae bacterium]|nr:alpha/beta fold hydrolase [Verrucomicrobiaceae bacterium]